MQRNARPNSNGKGLIRSWMYIKNKCLDFSNLSICSIVTEKERAHEPSLFFVSIKVLTYYNTCIIIKVTKRRRKREMEKIKVDEFKKKGKTIEVLVKFRGIEGYAIFLRANGHEVYSEIRRIQGVDGYRVSKD